MRLSPPALFGAAALALASAGAAWFAFAPGDSPAGEALPTPPDPPRLVDSPEYDRCLALLATDAQDALAFAERWQGEGGGEGAEHCAALAQLGLGEPEQAAEALEAVAGRSEASAAARAAVFGQAAQAWMLAEKPARARDAASRALALTPDDTWLLMDRATAASAQDHHAEALADLDRAVQIEPTRAEAWVLRASTLRQLDRVDDAARDIERALQLAPDNPEALLERGIIRQLHGDSAGARADWSRALELAPDSPTGDLAAQNLALNEVGPQRR